MTAPSNLPSSAALEAAITEMANALRAALGERLETAVMVGIYAGGELVAQLLHKQLQLTQPLGRVSIAFHRDDYAERGLKQNAAASQLNELAGCDVILVDDVIESGRSVRAAINELFDFGRPGRVWLAVLADRGGRQLPIHPDVCGLQLSLNSTAKIKLQQTPSLSFALEPAALESANLKSTTTQPANRCDE